MMEYKPKRVNIMMILHLKTQDKSEPSIIEMFFHLVLNHIDANK